MDYPTQLDTFLDTPTQIDHDLFDIQERYDPHEKHTKFTTKHSNILRQETIYDDNTASVPGKVSC